MKITEIITRACLASIAVVGGGLLSSCAPNDTGAASGQAQPPAPPVAVQTTKPEHRNVSRLISIPGDIHPWEETTLYAKVPGYLSNISVDKGDRVKTGQVIATISSPELTADRNQAQQQYESALAAAQGSQATSERSGAEAQRSKAAKGKAEADYAQMPATVARAQAQMKQMQGAVRQAQEQKNQASAALEESQSQVEKVKADLEAAKADQKLADVTYDRYRGIFEKNPMLIARQEVDVAESRAESARSKTAAAQSAVEVAQHHVHAAQSQIDAAESQIAQAQAQVAAAQEQVNLTRALQNSAKQQVVVSAEDVYISEKQQAVSRAKTLETRFQANAGRSMLGRAVSFADYTRIRAPFSGVIVRRFVDRGAFIQTASTSQNAAPIATVANLDKVRLYLSVPETQARFVRVGTPVTITLTGISDDPIKGCVSRTGVSLDAKTRTLLAEVDLPNREGTILAGTYATARVVMETHPDVVSVPTAAVGVEKAGKFVFVVKNGKTTRVTVTTGFDDGTYTEITEGLHGGEEVVVTGRDTLTPNATVTTTQWFLPVKKLNP